MVRVRFGEPVFLILRSLVVLILAASFSVQTAVSSAHGSSVVISNNYLLVTASQGALSEIQYDPTGQGLFQPTQLMVLQPTVGDQPLVGIGVPIEVHDDGQTITFRGLRSVFAQSIGDGARVDALDYAEAGERLGQTFYARNRLYEIAIQVAGRGDNPQASLSIYRESPQGELIASIIYDEVPRSAWLTLSFDEQPSGLYYIELAVKNGRVGWYGYQQDMQPAGRAFTTTGESLERDRTVRASSIQAEYDWQIRLQNAEIQWEFFGRQLPAQLGVTMTLPWKRDGYDTTDPEITPFSRLFTSDGQYLPVEQFKRWPDFTLHGRFLENSWIHFTGKSGYDFRLSRFSSIAPFVMEADTMDITSRGRTGSLAFYPQDQPLPDYYPVFYSSDPWLDRLHNSFYYERAFSWLPQGCAPEWREFLGFVYAWVATPVRDDYFTTCARVSMDPDGYVWSWDGRRDWPLPPDDDIPPGLDKRHFTTNPTYILGTYRYWVWTRDDGYLNYVIDHLRRAMDYQLEVLNGQNGLIVIPFKWHEGTSESYPSNFWDVLPFGYKDAITNIYFYASLKAMAEMELTVGNKERAEYLMGLRTLVKQRFNETFWNEEAGRYIGTVDVHGNRHDYGFTMLNLEAMSYGLAEKQQAERIYHWMENEPTSTGEVDTYIFRFAPRLNTFDVSDWWYLGGRSQFPPLPFGSSIQNGGALLYYSGHDIIARARLLSPDNAYQRYSEILDRYSEPDKLTGGNPLYYGELDGWQVGTSAPYPEAGMAPASFLYAFLGIEASIDGMSISPNLPQSLSHAGVRNLSYGGFTFDIEVTHSNVTIQRLGGGNDQDGVRVGDSADGRGNQSRSEDSTARFVIVDVDGKQTLLGPGEILTVDLREAEAVLIRVASGDVVHD